MTGYLEEEGTVLSRSDEELLAAALARPALFAELVARYEAAFLRKAQGIVRSREEAEDIVQETFTKIYLHGKKFSPQEGASFSSWGYRILINTALTHYAKRKREMGTRADLEPELLALVPDKDLRQFEKKEFADLVASVLTRMPEPFARALTKFFLEGKSQEEIAREEGVSVGAIKTRVHRAKQAFKDAYESVTPSL